MNKNLKDFLKYLSLVVAVTLMTQTIEHYLTFDWAQKNAWIGALFFAFIFYELAK